MQLHHKSKSLRFLVSVVLIIPCGIGCKKAVEVRQVTDQLLATEVFSNDANANMAVNGIYGVLKRSVFDLSTFGPTVITGLAGDEFYNYSPNANADNYRTNGIQSNDTYINNCWTYFYKVIYQANSAIEGIQKSTGMTVVAKNQLAGEAKFCRALSYLYLVSLWGDVPLITSTDVNANVNAPRAPADAVYNLIIADLTEAKNLLSPNYLNTGGEKIRANKWAAVSLLSRAYLYKKDWANAAAQATDIINSGVYRLLTNLDSFAVKNNAESILMLANISGAEGNNEPSKFIFASTPNILCTNFLLNAFTSGDQRKAKWIKSAVYSSQTYYYPYKYKVNSTTGGNENYMLLRLGEQYLIRAEAEAQLNDIPAAISDLNVIRQRAGVLLLPSTLSQQNCLDSVIHERQLELFAETGHRWIDLKRTGRIDAVLGTEKPANWRPAAALFPIPLSEIQRDHNLTQNPGY